MCWCPKKHVASWFLVGWRKAKCEPDRHLSLGASKRLWKGRRQKHDSLRATWKQPAKLSMSFERQNGVTRPRTCDRRAASWQLTAVGAYPKSAAQWASQAAAIPTWGKKKKGFRLLRKAYSRWQENKKVEQLVHFPFQFSSVIGARHPGF